jgi:proteasome lid subunit RPN8/RPN11
VPDQSHLLIPLAAVDLLKREAVEAYPEECCGVLLGRLPAASSPTAEVHQVVVAQNSATDRREERFVIDPRHLLGAQKEARRQGLDVVGYYHSHPDRGATPGHFDRDAAWPEVGYLILAVSGRRVTEVRCWRLSESGETFTEVSIGYS